MGKLAQYTIHKDVYIVQEVMVLSAYLIVLLALMVHNALIAIQIADLAMVLSTTNAILVLQVGHSTMLTHADHNVEMG